MSKSQLEKIKATCKFCLQACIIARGTYQQAMRRNGFYRCGKCAPQRTKKFWEDPERKIAHSNSIKSSSVYYDSISKRKLSGENNGMFGKNTLKKQLIKCANHEQEKLGQLLLRGKVEKHLLIDVLRKL
jgi:hypothetical protein